MAERTIEGPDGVFLDKDQVAEYLGIYPEDLDPLIDSGQFPKPLKTGDTYRWIWTDVVYYALRVALSDRLRVAQPST